MIFIVISILLIFLFFTIIGYLLSGPGYHGPISNHFDGKKFHTPDGQPAKGPRELLRWMTSRKRGPWNIGDNFKTGAPPPARVGRGCRITFVNHSTFLLQIDGINFLTDPVWSERTSPFQWAGPKRMRAPGIRWEDLPKIDVVILSHNHYDHLDLATMRKLFEKNKPAIITPLGVRAFLDKEKIAGAIDLDWWQEFSLNENMTIQSVPAQHFSGRGMFDRDATLWCGYTIRRAGGNIYFAGDTGYNPVIFKEIQKKCSPVDIALLPIGAFKPEWFMSPIHCSPDEAVKIHIEIGARKSIATHFGTFPLADDGVDEPVTELRSSLFRNKISEEDFIALEEGQYLQL